MFEVVCHLGSTYGLTADEAIEVAKDYLSDGAWHVEIIME